VARLRRSFQGMQKNLLPTTEMISRTPTLAEWPYRTVRLACDLCPRRGQYRKETLLARFGGDVPMPDVRHLIAKCPHKDAPARRVLR
jgi:hypothetical protein